LNKNILIENPTWGWGNLLSNLSGALKEGYSPFQGRLSFKDFEVKVNSLPIDMWNFVRASLLYQKALQCRKCEPNIAMVLLCSCPDALKVSGKKAKVRTNYRSFYSKYCPPRLKDPPIKILSKK